MKIGNPADKLATGSQAPAKKPATEGELAPASLAKEGVRATTTGASVSVSTLARSLEQSDRGVGGDFDNVKVEAIRSAIQGGTYKVNPEAIADKLLANASEMLNVNRGY